MNCAGCSVQHCQIRKRDDLPDGCPMFDEDCIKQGVAEYHKPENKKFYADSLESMRQSFCKMPRIIEAVNFCKLSGYKKIGIAYCSGMLRFGRIVNDIFIKNGFEVYSTGCKVGGFSPEELTGCPMPAAPSGDLKKQRRAICNPIGQALFFNNEQTEFNVVVGLCVGHDSLFFKYSNAPCTVVVLKDRLFPDQCAPSIKTAAEWEFND